jgi:hypothetical protein
MTGDMSQDRANNVFGGAAHAVDYIEEDTTSVALHLGRRVKTDTPAAGPLKIPPMPASPTRPEDASALPQHPNPRGAFTGRELVQAVRGSGVMNPGDAVLQAIEAEHHG